MTATEATVSRADLEADRWPRVSDAIFRVSFSLIFLVAGLGHFVQRDVMLARLEAAPLGHLATLVGPPDVLMMLSGAGLVFLVTVALAPGRGLITRWKQRKQQQLDLFTRILLMELSRNQASRQSREDLLAQSSWSTEQFERALTRCIDDGLVTVEGGAVALTSADER